jgi:putative flippase GtrA
MLEDPMINIMNDQLAGFTAAKATATSVAFLWNYLANRSWTFRQPQSQISG